MADLYSTFIVIAIAIAANSSGFLHKGILGTCFAFLLKPVFFL